VVDKIKISGYFIVSTYYIFLYKWGISDVIRTITDMLLLLAPLVIVYAIWFTTKNIEKDEKGE